MTTASEIYGDAYQLAQIEKYRNRENNHWSIRIQLAFDLFDAHVQARFADRPKSEITVVDIGCSIGTFAIEFAKRGYRAIGVDFDQPAIELAEQLAAEEGVAPRFYCGDVADLDEQVDVAICFDIFEHLFDDQLGALFYVLRNTLSSNGAIVFHTFPNQFDYLLVKDQIGSDAWLETVRRHDPDRFEQATRALASLHDAWMLLLTGRNHADRISETTHPNPLTATRLKTMLQRAGFDVTTLQTELLYDYGDPERRARLGNQSVAHRNIFGVVTQPAS